MRGDARRWQQLDKC